MQKLKGFREFYPEGCAQRNYILSRWREVARRYGFVEYDGPTVEPLALYEKKSGGELVGQLFTVGALVEQQETDGPSSPSAKWALRPEMTPTLARMVAARGRDFKKPLKWFCLPQFFRHENTQGGRLREFYQLNCDILGEASAGADAELIATAIDMLRAFGLVESDFFVRLSSRAAWQQFFAANGRRTDGAALQPEDEYEFFQIVDKAERAAPEQTDASLAKFGLTGERVMEFMRSKEPSADLAPILADLAARGLAGYVDVDYAIVRGLAYYTGVVFEIFDRSRKERALAGGGRYDKLLSLMSDGKVDLPALGFGMGDVVLAKVLEKNPLALAQMEAWVAKQRAIDIYIVVAKEERRPQALALAQKLRDAGQRTDFPLVGDKVGKQFQAAEYLGARFAVLVGDEWPQVKLKTLATREERLVDERGLIAAIVDN